MDFSINFAGKVLSTYVQFRCNNNLLPHCVFLNTVRAKVERFHYFLMDSSEFATETNFLFQYLFLNAVWHMDFKFSKSQTLHIFCILFSLSHLGWRELQNYSLDTVLFVIYEISEFGTDLKLITWKRVCVKVFGSINF